MWGKWIGCEVPDAARGRFAAAQRAWSAIGDQPGLVGQVGGWDPAGGRAHVLGLWADAAAHRHYAAEYLPGLRSRARLAGDVRALTGHLLTLEPAWRVLPAA
ncbi:DUF4937 domain-containing protein [Kitasatospora sp. NPDC094028]